MNENISEKLTEMKDQVVGSVESAKDSVQGRTEEGNSHDNEFRENSFEGDSTDENFTIKDDSHVQVVQNSNGVDEMNEVSEEDPGNIYIDESGHEVELEDDQISDDFDSQGNTLVEDDYDSDGTNLGLGSDDEDSLENVPTPDSPLQENGLETIIDPSEDESNRI